MTTAAPPAGVQGEMAALRLLVETLAVEVRDLRAQVAALRRPGSAGDRLSVILPAIVGAIGSETRTAKELIASPHAGLRIALRGMSPRQLGKLLARATDRPCGEYVVRECGLEHGARLWRVERLIVG